MNPTSSEHDADMIRRLVPVLVLFARQRCRCAEDVVQESMLKWFEQRPRPEDPRSWLFQVVRRRAANAERSERRRTYHENVASSHKPEVWFAPSPELGLDVEAVTESLHRLSLEHREIIVARLWGELSYDEIGALTGVSPSTATRHYRAALESLRRDLNIVSTHNE